MDEAIRFRCLQVAEWMITHQATVRQAARAFGLSKSSVHKDLTQRLPEVSHARGVLVQQLMQHNKAQRHLRGGDATRLHYALQRQARALQNPPDAVY